MKTREHALAVLMDLESELAGMEPGHYAQLRKIAGFSTVALALRQQMLPADHDWLTGELQRTARGHGIPEVCIYPDGPSVEAITARPSGAVDEALRFDAMGAAHRAV